MKSYFVLDVTKRIILTLTLLITAFRCSDDQMLIEPTSLISSEDLNSTTLSATDLMDCSSCDYVLPEGQALIDGISLGLKPGSVIGLRAGIPYRAITLRNVIGTAENPIIIRNCGGQARIDATGQGHGITTLNSRFFRITGGDQDNNYGIVINAGQMSLNLGGLATDFEIDHLEIQNSGFAGIMAKTDPSCNEATWRENYLMQNVRIHHNYIHDTGGEGIYAGNSWYGGMNTACGVKYPHDIHNLSIDHNILKNTGWESIQVGCATKGAKIHDNVVENYGTANRHPHNNGVQIGAGTGGLFYNNLIKKGSGNGLIVMGIGDNIIFNNIIDQAGNHGVFCDERVTPGPGFQFLNNTILNPGGDGIRIYAELVPMNVIVNNIITNPGTYSSYVYPRTPEDAFVYKLSKDVRIDMTNNFFTTSPDTLAIVQTAQSDYWMDNGFPIIDLGRDVSAFHDITTDFLGNPRVVGATYDIGAIELYGDTDGRLPNVLPVVDAGTDRELTLPDNSLALQGSATDADGTIASLQWRQMSGTAATLEGQSTATLMVSNLEKGSYVFRLTATDNAGESQHDDVSVTVLSEFNTPPVANAGPNQVVAYPTSSVQLLGSGKDSDGSIVSYKWTQYGGADATIGQPTSPSTTISGLAVGKYYFRLTVEDNEGATHSDDVLVRVDGNAIPVANAGPNQVIVLPQNSVVLAGKGTDSDGTIVAWKWTQYGGPAAYIENANAPTATVSGLIEGKYYFRLTVTDNDGAKHSDNVLVRVDPAVEADAGQDDSYAEANLAPEVSAGPNMVLTLPESSTTLYGSASDSDGTIASYQWIQYGGPEVQLTGADEPTAHVSGLDEGKYYFRLIVEDNDGASNYDNVLVRVSASSEI